MRLELTRLQQEVGITFIIVTHDQDEALSMATRIAVMEKGAIKQLATPEELYEHPTSRFVADFIGKVNLFEANVISQKGKAIVCNAKGLGKINLSSDKECGKDVTIAVRPEKLKLSKAAPKADGLIKAEARVRDVAYYGDWSEVVVELNNGQMVSVNVQNERRDVNASVTRGEKTYVSWSPSDSLVLTE